MDEWVVALKESAAAGLRPLEGKISLDGFPGEARITTDRWGVPHVDAVDRETLYAAQGYLHSTERLWQVEFTRRIAEGRLSELVGEPGYGVDRFFRTLGLARTARRWVAEGVDDATERIGRAYHAGFVAGARSLPPPIEFQILAAAPEIPETFEDAAAHTLAQSLLIAFGLSMNWSLELLRFQLAQELGAERAAALTPFMGTAPPTAVPPRRNDRGAIAELLATARSAGAAGPGVGSNNWVLAGSRTTTGAPLLCNDPHLLAQMPAIWMETHLRCPDLNVSGVSFPGVPGIIIGHNDRIAWGFTNTQADVTDLYLEKLSDDETRCLHDGTWEPIEVIHEHISVRNEAEPRVHDVRVTRHGPIVTDLIIGAVDTHVRENAVGAPLALRWVHLDRKISQGPIERINEARDWEEFRAAALTWPTIGQNMVYADVDGHIGYQFTGSYPVRRRGSGVAPAPGWDPDYEWDGTIDPEELPWAFDPPDGFLATANNKVVTDDFPYYLTHDWEPAWRIGRIHHVLGSKPKHSADDMAALQADTFSGIAAVLLSDGSRWTEPGAAGAEQLGAARKMLETWNRRMDPSEPAAALFCVWLDELARRLFHHELGDELFDFFHTNRSWVSAFSSEAILEWNDRRGAAPGDADDDTRSKVRTEALLRAWDRCVDLLGDDASTWRWGALHQITFAHPMARALPPLAELFSAGPFEAGGADDTVNRGTYTVGENFQTGGIPSYRQIVDLGDFDRSRSVITTGCSGNPASPYYTNQTALWLAGEHHPMLFTPEAIDAEAAGTVVVSGT